MPYTTVYKVHPDDGKVHEKDWFGHTTICGKQIAKSVRIGTGGVMTCMAKDGCPKCFPFAEKFQD